jgi:RNA polymerase sigma factor (TIGR02999 family)
MTREPSRPAGDLTELLAAASGGNAEALNALFPLVYEELRRLAHSRLRAERTDHTLNTTALVHEAYLKLVGQKHVQWQNRAHFYAVAARAMRRILINYAEARRASKRGGGAARIPLEDAELVLHDDRLDELLALDQALARLKGFSPRGVDIITYRFFGGLTHEEIAEVMSISEVTVRRTWSSAKSWLRRELRAAQPEEPQRASHDVPAAEGP